MKKTSIISIHNISIQTRIGLESKERSIPQTLILNIDLLLDMEKAIKTDDIKDTVDYLDVIENIINYTKSSEHKLIETLSEKIVHICLEFPLIEKTIVKVHKSSVSNYAGSIRSVSIEIEKTQ